MTKYMTSDECILCGRAINMEVPKPDVLPAWLDPTAEYAIVLLGPSGVGVVCVQCLKECMS